MDPRDYQVECIESIIAAVRRKVYNPLVEMATGGGKTIIGAEIVRKLNLQKKSMQAFIVAHRFDLLEGMAETIHAVAPELRLAFEKAQAHKGDPNADVILGMIQTLGRAESERLRAYDPKRCALIVTDEAHHSLGSTYNNFYTHFGVPFKGQRDPDNRVIHLGLTATPERGDREHLRDYYDEVVYSATIKDLTGPGWLVAGKHTAVPTNLDLSKVKTTSTGDFHKGQLRDEIERSDLKSLVVKDYKENCDGASAIAFCVDVENVFSLVEAFEAKGIPAAGIVGDTSPEERQYLREQHKKGHIKVLANCEVLTEGSNMPWLDAYLGLRPTKSPALIRQTYGRCTRRLVAPGTDDPLLRDDGTWVKPDFLCREYVDTHNWGHVCTTPEIYDLPRIFDGKGENLYDLSLLYDTLVEKIGLEAASRVKNATDLRKALENAAWFLKKIGHVKSESIPELERANYVWFRCADGSIRTTVDSGNRDKDIPKSYLVLQPDILGKYAVGVRKGRVTRTIHHTEDLTKAVAYGEWAVREYYPRAVKLVDKSAKWREEEPTWKQIQFCRKLKIFPLPRTKGEAQIRIEERMAK